MIIKSKISPKTNKPYMAVFSNDKIVSFDNKLINGLIDLYAYELGLHPKIVYKRVYDGELEIDLNF